MSGHKRSPGFGNCAFEVRLPKDEVEAAELIAKAQKDKRRDRSDARERNAEASAKARITLAPVRFGGRSS